MLEQTDVKKSYSTNGSQTIFPIPFPFDDPSHIEVWIRNNATKLQDPLVNPGDYIVSGSNVIMNDVWPAGYTLWVYRIHPETQTLDLIENDNLPAESLEKRFDKLTQMVQQLQEQLSRALLLPETSPYGNLFHPEPEENKFLVWKGGILVNGERFISSSDSTIQAFMKTFLESLTAAIARANLGTVGVDHDHVGGDGAQIDHGGLGGLGDDDHTQYAKEAFKTVKVGATNIVADARDDTLELAEGDGINLTPDAVNDKVTITGDDLGHLWSTAAGYVKLPGGLIIQFGNTAIGANTHSLVNFALTFPNACLTAVCVSSELSYDGQPAAMLSFSTTQMDILNGAGVTTTIRWIAIGY